MHMIRSKNDALRFLNEFEKYAAFDSLGKKHYFIIEDELKNSQTTIMKYNPTFFTTHSFGVDYCEQGETSYTFDHISSFVWKNRKHINRKMKENTSLKKQQL